MFLAYTTRIPRVWYVFLIHATWIPQITCSYHIPHVFHKPCVQHLLLVLTIYQMESKCHQFATCYCHMPYRFYNLHATCLPHASKPCHMDSSCHMCATCSFYMPQGFHMSYYCHFFLTHATCLSNHKLHNSYVNATEFFKKYEFLCPAMPPHTTRRFITCVTAWCHNIF